MDTSGNTKMSIEQKAKAYEMALEAARKELGVDRKEWEVVQRVLHNIFPELRESEDERIRKEIISALKFANDGGVYDKHIAYLEKQKENPKNTISIPADCVSDAKCEDRWHKTANSLPDDGRDVLAKDAIGNYLLASFDGAQWFVSVYDGQDHPVLHTPPILEWCEIPSEKQKEQKSAWSEEDEKIMDTIVSVLGQYIDYKAVSGTGSGYATPRYSKEIDWLKSLRPSWKPSDEQMEALEKAIVRSCSHQYSVPLSELYEQLKKL